MVKEEACVFQYCAERKPFPRWTGIFTDLHELCVPNELHLPVLLTAVPAMLLSDSPGCSQDHSIWNLSVGLPNDSSFRKRLFLQRGMIKLYLQVHWKIIMSTLLNELNKCWMNRDNFAGFWFWFWFVFCVSIKPDHKPGSVRRVVVHDSYVSGDQKSLSSLEYK